MIIRQNVLINKSPEKVWQYIVDPQKVQLWNPKLVKVDRFSLGKEALWYKYEVTYALNGKENNLSAQIVKFDKPYHLKIACQELQQHNPKWVDRKIYEEYILKAKGTQTYLEQIITIENSGIPWILRLMIWFVLKFGKAKNPNEKQYLVTLKNLVENDNTI